MTRRSVKLVGRVSISALAVLLFAKSSVAASHGDELVLNITAQPLDSALNSWASQTGYSVLMPFNTRTALMAPGVGGRFTAERALKILLAGSDLEYDVVNSSTIAIRTADLRTKISGRESGSEGEEKISNESPRVANQQEHEVPSKPPVADGGDDAHRQRGVPEVLVTGSRILNADIRRSRDGAQPYVVFDSDSIKVSGAVDLQTFLKERLPAATGSVSNSQFNSGSNLSKINLRGLGEDETLILIDGRRVAGPLTNGASGQPDINSIPLAAIERIEILPATASGIYGGGATGGVINIIMRRDYTGVDAQLGYGNVVNGAAASRRVDISGGFTLEGGRTSVSLFASWADANPLLTGDRVFGIRARERIVALRGYEGLGSVVGATTNITSLDGDLSFAGSNLSLQSPITFVPYGYAGPSSDGGTALLANAGRYNLDIPDTAENIGAGGMGKKGALVNSPTVKSISTTLRRDFTPQFTSVIDFSKSENAGNFARTPSLNQTVIPAGAPGNPFNQDVLIDTPAIGASGLTTYVLRTTRVSGAAILKLPSQWGLELDYTWNRTTQWSSEPSTLNRTNVTADISSGGLDVFRDTNRFPVDFSRYTLDPSTVSPADSTLKDASIRVSGPLPLSLPGGEPTLSALTEYRRENVGAQYSIFPADDAADTFRSFAPSASQSVSSLYLEALLPLVSERNRRRGLRAFDIQLAGRYDRYRINGASQVTLDANLVPKTPVERRRNRLSSVDPTVALRYQPIEDVTLRTSFGTGFLPPAVTQLVPRAPFLTRPRLRDPLRGNEALGTILRTLGGNADLSPEESKSWSAGLILTPRVISGLRASVDWTRIEKSDGIASLSISPQSSFEQFLEAAPERVTRGAPTGGFAVGPITAIDQSLINITSLKIEAIDLAVNYDIETSRSGKLAFAILGTKLVSLETQLLRSSPVVENAGVGPAATAGGTFDGGGLRWKATGAVTWNYSDWTLGWSVRYYDSYFLNVDHSLSEDQGAAKVPSQVYQDLFGSYRLPAEKAGIFADSEIRVGCNNFLNRKPPLDVVGTGFGSPGYSYFGDPRLANYYLSISKRFGN